jgi:hypothetical protein
MQLIRIKPQESGANGVAAAFACSGFSAASLAVVLFRRLSAGLAAIPALPTVYAVACIEIEMGATGTRVRSTLSAKPVRYHVLLG